jgi:NAD(P)-dependent dehydrogenase (short-subunit alcohol dehydrogenase family)
MRPFGNSSVKLQIYAMNALIADNNLEDYDNIQNTNAKGVLHHTKAAITVMLKQEPLVVQGVDRARVIGRGAIVNVCSDAGLVGLPGSVEYNASKFAAVGITKTAGKIARYLVLLPSSYTTQMHRNRWLIKINSANEYGASQIRINAMCPGPIQTPLLESYLALQPSARNGSEQSTSLGRNGDPQEVADAILFLTSTAGSYVHGTAMSVDGGFLNRPPLLF